MLLEVRIEEFNTRLQLKLLQRRHWHCYSGERVQREEKEIVHLQQLSLYKQSVCHR
jgi:hypothetical protein